MLQAAAAAATIWVLILVYIFIGPSYIRFCSAAGSVRRGYVCPKEENVIKCKLVSHQNSFD